MTTDPAPTTTESQTPSTTTEVVPPATSTSEAPSTTVTDPPETTAQTTTTEAPVMTTQSVPTPTETIVVPVPVETNLRLSINVNVNVNVWRGNTPVRVVVPVHDPHAGVYRHHHGRDYYRYYFGGKRDVVGYWVGVPFAKESCFVPTEWKEDDNATTFTPVTSQNVGKVVGVDKPGGDPSENPSVSLTPPSTEQPQDSNTAAIATGVVVLILLAGSAVGVAVYRRRQQ